MAKRRKCKVIYSYINVDDGELQLNIGDEIEILDTDQYKWYGKSAYSVGWFSPSFVELVDNASSEYEFNAVTQNVELLTDVRKTRVRKPKTNKPITLHNPTLTSIPSDDVEIAAETRVRRFSRMLNFRNVFRPKTAPPASKTTLPLNEVVAVDGGKCNDQKCECAVLSDKLNTALRKIDSLEVQIADLYKKYCELLYQIS